MTRRATSKFRLYDPTRALADRILMTPTLIKAPIVRQAPGLEFSAA